MSATTSKTKKIAMLAMLAAIAYVVMYFGRIPVVLFLKYDPKDVIITIGGLIFGPLSAFAVSAVVSLVEMVTASDTGIIGCIMNILSTCAFACTASAIYQKLHKLRGAIIGLVVGIIVMTIIMLLWNYLLVPLYTPNMTREAVLTLIPSAFLPFNLLKGSLNAAITILIYKPVVGGLRKSGLLPPSQSVSATDGSVKSGSKINVGVMLVAALVLITCILLVLAFNGII